MQISLLWASIFNNFAEITSRRCSNHQSWALKLLHVTSHVKKNTNKRPKWRRGFSMRY